MVLAPVLVWAPGLTLFLKEAFKLPRTKAEIEADLERLNAELADAVDEVDDVVEEHSEVIEEAIEATEDAIEEAVEDAVEEIEDAIEEAAEETAEEAPLVDSGEDVEAAVAARVIAEIEEKYDLVPKAESIVVEDHHHIEHIEEDAAPVESAPHSEHWSRRRIFR